MKSPLWNAVRQVPLYLINFALLFMLMDRTINIYDEGLILTGAMRVLAGEIPHRDFYANYGPGQFYTLAALFKIFEPSVLVGRLYDTALRTGILLLVFNIARHYCRKWIAALMVFSVLAWLMAVGGYLYPVIPVLFLSLAAASLLLGHQTQKNILAAGALTGLAALFRYDAGFFLMIALTLGIVVQAQNWRAALRDIVTYGVGVALVFMPVAAAYLMVAPLSAFLNDIVIFPSKFYVATRELPFPPLSKALGSPSHFIVYLPLVVIGVALTTLRAQPRAMRIVLLQLCLLTALLYLKGVVRVSPLHLLLGIVPALVMVGVLAESAFTLPHKWMRGVVSVLVILTVIVSVAGFNKRYNRQSRDATMVMAQIVTGAPLDFITSDDRFAAAAFVMGQVPPEERIFVGLDRHDRTFINDNYFYFAARRLPATHWHHFDPALQDSAPIQQQMIAEFEAAPPRLVVLEANILGDPEPNTSANSTGVGLLDDYIASHYRPVLQFGDLTVLEPDNP